MTQIIRAQHMGFCFGVRDALTAAAEVDRPDQTTIYGGIGSQRRCDCHASGAPVRAVGRNEAGDDARSPVGNGDRAWH